MNCMNVWCFEKTVVHGVLSPIICELKFTNNLSLVINSTTVFPSSQIQNLRIIFKPTLSKHHTNHTFKTAFFFHQKNIACLWLFSPAETLIHAFITSRCSYSHNILTGLNLCQNVSVNTTSVSILHNLHWPIQNLTHHLQSPPQAFPQLFFNHLLHPRKTLLFSWYRYLPIYIKPSVTALNSLLLYSVPLTIAC